MILENLRIALISLFANKLRTILTMLGIIIGVAAVVILLSLGQGVQTYIRSQFDSLGAQLIRASAIRGPWSRTEALSLSTAEAIADPSRVPAASMVMPQTSASYAVVYSGNEFSVDVQGVTTDYLAIQGREVTSGRFFTDADMDNYAQVALIGVETVENLFDTADPVGKYIRIGRVLFEVIGVLDDTGGQNDDLVVVPLTTAQLRLNGERTTNGDRPVNTILVLAQDSSQIDVAMEQVERVLREERGIEDGEEDDFRVFSASVIAETLTSTVETITVFLGIVAGISLLVGGIGVMNIMLVNINERTREIGLRKAVGAQGWDIVLQFLTEAVVITLAGGLIGVSIAVLVATLASSLIPDFSASVSIPSVVLAFGISASIGMFFGVYPARRASRLNPIDALRYE
ncbi:MAG: multidrug ABC transporter substrate-binding protein [Anaerolineaceae bacterium]|nr:multidrug ABC transporter substrate-binding protein [Anaerolineaceae bacterium]